MLQIRPTHSVTVDQPKDCAALKSLPQPRPQLQLLHLPTQPSSNVSQLKLLSLAPLLFIHQLPFITHHASRIPLMIQPLALTTMDVVLVHVALLETSPIDPLVPQPPQTSLLTKQRHAPPNKTLHLTLIPTLSPTTLPIITDQSYQVSSNAQLCKQRLTVSTLSSQLYFLPSLLQHSIDYILSISNNFILILISKLSQSEALVSLFCDSSFFICHLGIYFVPLSPNQVIQAFQQPYLFIEHLR